MEDSQEGFRNVLPTHSPTIFLQEMLPLGRQGVMGHAKRVCFEPAQKE